jgi:hypothetical protein
MALENEGGEVETQAQGEIAEASPSKETFDRPAVESKVAEGLAAIFGDDAEDHTKPEAAADETEKSSEEEVPEDQPTEEDKEEEAGKEKPETEEQEEPAAAVTPPKGNAPTLPEAYRRSLKAYGWEDADIDANLKAIGGQFIVTAQKIHQNRNTEIAQYAAVGRAERERQQQAREGQQTQKFEAIKPIDGAALKEHFGDDKLIDSLLNPINAVVAQINAMVPAIQQTQQKSQVAELETLGRQVEGFFTSKELQPYAEVFGNSTKELTDQQIGERNKVLETADALMAGAPKAMGRTLSLGEALQFAFDSVSGNYKAKAARKEITSALKLREKGISLKPGNKSKAAASGGPPVKTRGDLEKKVKSGLSSVFG